MRHMRSFLRQWGVFIVLGLACGGPVFAMGTATCPASLRIGVSLLGVSYYKTGTEAEGYDVDIARELGRRLNSQIELVEMNRTRLFMSLAGGRYIDMTMSSTPSPERDKSGDFVALGQTRPYLLILSKLGDQGFDFKQFMANPKLRVGVLAGADYGSYVSDQLADLQRQHRLDGVSDVASLIPRLIMGRNDGILATPPVFAVLRRAPQDQAKVRILPLPDAPFRPAGAYLSHSTLNDECRQKIRQALDAIRQDGALLRIYRRYFSEEWAQERLGPASQ